MSEVKLTLENVHDPSFWCELSERLKPCPFCGGKAIICQEVKWVGEKHIEPIHISCIGCGIKTPKRLGDIGTEHNSEKLIEMWNMRIGGKV